MRKQKEPSREGLGTTRREWLRQGALAGAGIGSALLGGAGCRELWHQAKSVTGSAPAIWTPMPPDANAVAVAAHVLNRVAFGPRPGDIPRVGVMGAKAWIREQLDD